MLDLLTLPGPVDRPLQLEGAEHTPVPAPMQGIEPPHLSTVFQDHSLSRIAITEKRQIRLERIPAQLQNPSPEPFLHLVRRLSFLERGL